MLILGHLGETHSTWDPLTLAVLILATGIFLEGPAGRAPSRRACFVAGLVVVAVAVASPLESLAAELASAHMAQHILLVMVAAPLLASSRPLDGLIGGLPRSWRKRLGRSRRSIGLTPGKTRLVSPIVVWGVYAGSLWMWHASALYELALASDALHALEHGFFLAAAVAFWSFVLVGRQSPGLNPGLRALMVFTTAFHSVLLAALLTFADAPWYASYADTAPHWGLTPINDQRLAGLLMWIPGGLLYTATGIWLLVGWIRRTENRSVSKNSALSRENRHRTIS